MMSHQILEGFCFADWRDLEGEAADGRSDAVRYGRIVEWAAKARGCNPNAFDALTEWIRDDSQWAAGQLADNRRILMDGVIARFQGQNAELRERLRALEPSGVVNPSVFDTLDRFDEELSGVTGDLALRGVVSRVFEDFSAMRERDVREQIAGSKTGPAGIDSVESHGYVNQLKECDASVQWALFMPDLVRRQQDGFALASFEYLRMPAMRFLGRDGKDVGDDENRRRLARTLDAMAEHASGFDHDVLLVHHDGLGVDVDPGHEVWGRFLKAGAPVPEGFLALDFVPECGEETGPPYCSQFAFATFVGNTDAMHRREGHDVNAMYDVTRNVILGQDVIIPYPAKYWTAEVFLNGIGKPGSGYLFSVVR